MERCDEREKKTLKVYEHESLLTINIEDLQSQRVIVDLSYPHIYAE